MLFSIGETAPLANPEIVDKSIRYESLISFIQAYSIIRKYKACFHISSILVVKDSNLLDKSVSAILEKYDPGPLVVCNCIFLFCERMSRTCSILSF